MTQSPAPPSHPAQPAEPKYTCETITHRTVWLADRLFSVRTTRDTSFNYLPGQFARIGLKSKPDLAEPDVWRAYSMVTHPLETELEFYCVVVPDGQFSPLLEQQPVGAPIWVERKPFGFLTLDRFTPADSLWLVATGTGISAFLPMLESSDIWQQFKTVVFVHGVRTPDELAYRESIERLVEQRQDATGGKLKYLPICSQAALNGPNRITSLYENDTLESLANEPLNPEQSRIMLCGNPAMVTEMRNLLSLDGFAAGRRGVLGTLAVENYL
ncbi:MAG: ferredoxin--NADP reductase [Burkholderiaceae bacterium]|nr:ferredoxin--NADP reductase [Burkholderiaceae bacterium]